MCNSVEVSIKRVVSVGWWCPKAFGVKGVRLVISSVVVKKFSNAQTSGKFVKISFLLQSSRCVGGWYKNRVLW